jgi:hypothetical protein
MKKVIAALIAGLTLGTAGTAIGAQSYWRPMNRDIECQATKNSVVCGTRHPALYDYSVYISGCSVAVWQDRGGADLKDVFERWHGRCR